MNARTNKAKDTPEAEQTTMTGRAGAVKFRRDASGAPGEGSRIQVTVTSDLHDRWEGLAETIQMWGDKPNTRYLTKKMAKKQTREEVAEFFNARGIVEIIKQMSPVPMLKPNETAFSKDEYIDFVKRNGKVSEDAVAVIVELTLPALIALGYISNNIKYSTQVRYGFDRVTIADLRLEVTVFQVMEAVKNVSTKSIDPTRKIAKGVFAEALGEAFRPIGLALYEIVDLSGVVDDIVVGVRANIDPAVIALGSVPPDWRNHRVVQEVAQNLTFVRHALLEHDVAKMRVQNDAFKLERWAPVVLSAIKSSERYQWVGKAEALRHITTRKVRNMQGRVLSVVACRRVQVQPVAQSVIATEDRALKDSFNINGTNDRIAEVVQSAYGQATFSTELGAELIADTLMDGVQFGWNNPEAGYMVDARGEGPSLTDVAVMAASRLYAAVQDGKVMIDPESAHAAEKLGASAMPGPVWWFVVPTKELSMNVYSGTHMGSEVVTSDPVEALMACDEMTASDALPARPQMLSSAAFNTRIVDFLPRLLHKVDARYSFDVDVLGVHLRGAFRPQDVGSLRAKSNLTALVTPHFNEGVINGLQQAYALARSVLTQMESDGKERWITNEKPTEAFFHHIRNRTARSLLKTAQQLSPAFRQEIHQLMIERAIVSQDKAGDEAMRLRATLAQKTYGAYADVIALHFFLFLQGIELDGWEEIIKSPEMTAVAIEHGTDRDIKTI